MITVAPSVSTSIMSAFICSTSTTAKIASIGRCQRLFKETLRHLPVNHNGALRSFSAVAFPEEITGQEVDESIRRLKQLVDEAKGKTLAITGAGVSTDSGIPDYRGPAGSYSRGHKPMLHDEFISSEKNRKRYWARSTLGWQSFHVARPNATHRALAELEAVGKVDGVITQNVDGLHQKAGSIKVVDLHGKNDKVECLSCGLQANRNAHQEHLARLNQSWIERTFRAHANAGDGRLRADGDAELAADADLADFIIPACGRCGGVLKPSVVFFGDNIPRDRVEETYRMVDDSRLVIVAGSSLQVFSAFRLVDRAAKAGTTVVVVNRGSTRAERTGLPLLKVDAGVGEVFPLLL